jgi:hypothetical protein
MSRMVEAELHRMKLFDFEPTFFESQDEAAVYFEYTARKHLPQVSHHFCLVGRINISLKYRFAFVMFSGRPR